jgi:hypothetical protein
MDPAQPRARAVDRNVHWMRAFSALRRSSTSPRIPTRLHRRKIGSPMSSSSAPRFTEKQGQYLAFIATYTLLNRRPPAEADFQRFFQVTPPAVHQMVVELERRGLISRVPGQPRTIKVTLPDDELPRLQPIKTSAAGY